jgi:DNA-binding transcriptional LysR family regulator
VTIGSLTIGIGGYATETILPKVLMRFRELFPDVTLILHEAHTAGQIDALRRGDIDASLSLLPATYDDVDAELTLQDGFFGRSCGRTYAGTRTGTCTAGLFSRGAVSLRPAFAITRLG